MAKLAPKILTIACIDYLFLVMKFGEYMSMSKIKRVT
jgi:hypothetical protein